MKQNQKILLLRLYVTILIVISVGLIAFVQGTQWTMENFIAGMVILMFLWGKD